MEELLYLLDALRRQIHDLVLFIYNEVACLGNLLTHQRRHLCDLSARLAAFQLACQDVADLIKLCRLSALSGNDQRCAGLINQDRVNLVNDRIFQIALYQLLLVNHHVVTQVIEAQFVVRHVGNVAGILLAALVVIHLIEYTADCQTQKLMHLPHPLRVTMRQIIIDRDNMDTLSGQGIQVSRKRRHQRLTFSGTHLGDAALVKDNAADDLHPVMLHPEDSLCCLPHRRVSLRKQAVQSLSVRVARLVFLCLRPQLFI